MEFDIGLLLHIPFFDDLDFYQFQWKFERLQKHKRDLNESMNGGKKFASTSDFQ
jgi:hypothetical protein